MCSGAFRDGNAPAYRALYAVIGKAYGIGDGSAASFNLPDMRGRTAIGLGQGIGLSARALAAKLGTEQITQVPNHTHPVNLATSSAGAHSHTLEGWAVSGGTTRFLDTAAASSTGTYTTSTSGNHSHTVTGNTGNPTGGVAGVDNLQPSLVLNFIIKL
jgi:microcystin-dependent protein